MEPLHVKIDYKEALESKKDILSSEINLLHIIKKMSNYKKLRKIEISKKNILRRELKEVLLKIDQIYEDLPGEEINTRKIKSLIKEMPVLKEMKKEKIKRKGIEAELEEIRKKLEEIS